jgi:hypothetical protein
MVAPAPPAPPARAAQTTTDGDWRNDGLVYPKGADMADGPSGSISSERLRRAAPRATAGVAGDAPLAAELEGLQGRPPQVLVQDAGAALRPIAPRWRYGSRGARTRANAPRRPAAGRWRDRWTGSSGAGRLPGLAAGWLAKSGCCVPYPSVIWIGGLRRISSKERPEC